MSVAAKAIDPEQPCFLRVPAKCLPVNLACLRASGFVSEAADVEAFTKHYTDPELNEERERWLEIADTSIARPSEIAFDSDATISESDDNGQYVLGWVWVTDSAKVEEDDDEDDTAAQPTMRPS